MTQRTIDEQVKFLSEATRSTEGLILYLEENFKNTLPLKGELNLPELYRQQGTQEVLRVIRCLPQIYENLRQHKTEVDQYHPRR